MYRLYHSSIVYYVDIMFISREQSAAAGVNDEAHSSGSEAILPFTTSVIPEGMTKRQWKKQLRQQRKMIMWEKNKWVKHGMVSIIYGYLPKSHNSGLRLRVSNLRV